jgi:GNAT superfamily N-acetyltransferase
VAVEIRDARPEDAGEIARLLGQLGYPAEEEAVTRRLALLGDDLLFVAEADGQVAGLAQLHISPSLEYDRPAAKLAALVVDDAHRNGGIGRALVDAAESEAQSRNCELLFLTTAERRADAHGFYERLGFANSGRRYAKRFP